EPPARIAIRGTFFGCCASAVVPNSANVRATATTPVDLRLWTLDFDFIIQHSKLTIQNCHFITLSALASTLGGIVTPICLAVFRLMTSSNFVGCSTGISPG